MKSAKAIFFDFEVFKYDWLVCITEYWLDDDKNIKTKDLVILNNRIQLIDYYRENKDKGIFIGKNSSRKYIREHDKHRKQEDLVLLASFINGTYKTSKYNNYIIYEPKKRIISKLPYYPDRIAHHAIMNIMKPIWISQMTNFTYANIKGRGIHACMKDISRTLYKTKNTDATKYYLKLDIRKFYPNISHNVLKDILKRKIKDNN